MIRLSKLRNYPVVIGQKKLGLLHSVSLDKAQKRVYALIVTRGMRSKCIVLPDDVQAVSDGFILARRFAPYKKSMEEDRSVFVRDTSGMLVGRIADCMLDETDFRVIAFLMQTGYSLHQRDCVWVYTYTRSEHASELIIPACLGSEQV